MICALCVADDVRPLDVPGGRVPGGRSASCFRCPPACTLLAAPAAAEQQQSRCVWDPACAVALLKCCTTSLAAYRKQVLPPAPRMLVL